jgi:hypothetical protein
MKDLTPPGAVKERWFRGCGMVLVVDDVPLVLAVTVLMVEDLGFNVLAANSGNEALATLSDQHVDMLIADIDMPGMKGPELAQEAPLERKRRKPFDQKKLKSLMEVMTLSWMRTEEDTMDGRRYKIGQLVNYLGRERASGVYQVTQLLPFEDETFQYRIKNVNEPHERVAKEHELRVAWAVRALPRGVLKSVLSYNPARPAGARRCPEALKDLGYERVYNLGAFKDWADSGGTVEKV